MAQVVEHLPSKPDGPEFNLQELLKKRNFLSYLI
jgi:hypothetical protein